ncbi:hypothetical protein ACIO52_02910 [Nocardia sp. NPDC087230]|uniref:hypothetical protein n=1 Tax=Nocardia sp. NPDC087230 TaxID=3364331 RepID=UPI00382BF7D5
MTATTPTDAPTTAPVESISTIDLANRVHFGTAGPVTELGEDPVIERWRQQFPGWRGKHWTYRADDSDTLRLHPLNVTRNRRTR